MTTRTLPALMLLLVVPSVLGTPRQRARVRARTEARVEARTDRAQERGAWELLGSKTVGRDLDHDTIAVTAKEGPFSRIRIDVQRAGVRIAALKVRYANGDVDDLPVREHVAAGGSTRAIDLQGAARAIREIEIWYETRTGADEKARVLVYGLRR